jgi:hypothetical protein
LKDKKVNYKVNFSIIISNVGFVSKHFSLGIYSWDIQIEAFNIKRELSYAFFMTFKVYVFNKNRGFTRLSITKNTID